jgi:hypothetical protein
MTNQELAKASLKFAEALGLSDDNREEFALEIMKLSLGFGDSPLETASRVAMEEPPEPESRVFVETDTPRAAKKRVKEMKKAAEKATPRKLLCRAETRCSCDICGKPLFMVLSDIYDGLKAEEFAAKFLPIGHTKTIPIPTRLRAIDGCVMTDCPVCGGEMSLILWGKRPEKDFDDNGVKSVGAI